MIGRYAKAEGKDGSYIDARGSDRWRKKTATLKGDQGKVLDMYDYVGKILYGVLLRIHNQNSQFKHMIFERNVLYARMWRSYMPSLHIPTLTLPVR